MPLKIGKYFYKLPRTLARGTLDRTLRAQTSDNAGEKTFGSAYCQKREMRAVVSDAGSDAARLCAKKCTEIDMGQNEFYLLDVSVEARTRRGKESRAAARLIPRNRKKTDKKRECDEDKDEVPHGD